MTCAVIINAGQANAAMRDAGYQDVRMFKRLSWVAPTEARGNFDRVNWGDWPTYKEGGSS